MGSAAQPGGRPSPSKPSPCAARSLLAWRRSRASGTTARRVRPRDPVTALIPLVAALLISRALIARSPTPRLQPEVGSRIEQAQGVYAASGQGHQAGAQVGRRRPSRAGAAPAGGGERGEGAAIDAELGRVFQGAPGVAGSCGSSAARGAGRAAAAAVDVERERTLEWVGVHRWGGERGGAGLRRGGARGGAGGCRGARRAAGPLRRAGVAPGLRAG